MLAGIDADRPFDGGADLTGAEWRLMDMPVER